MMSPSWRLPSWRLPSWRVLVPTAVAVVLLAAVGLGAWLWTGAQARAAADVYAGALTRLHASDAAEASPDRRAAAVRDLESALARYPSATMAGQAAYELGNARFASRDYAAARAAYEIALARSESPTVQTLARAGIGYTWEGEKNFDRAAETFRAALTSLAPGNFFFEQLLLDLARVQEAAGRKDDAVATYRRLLKEIPHSHRADHVRTRLANLGTAPEPPSPPAPK